MVKQTSNSNRFVGKDCTLKQIKLKLDSKRPMYQWFSAAAMFVLNTGVHKTIYYN